MSPGGPGGPGTGRHTRREEIGLRGQAMQSWHLSAVTSESGEHQQPGWPWIPGKSVHLFGDWHQNVAAFLFLQNSVRKSNLTRRGLD